MRIETTRFGVVEATEQDLIQFPGGIIGFPKECSFAMIPHGSSPLIAWLQSATTPNLAFPVVSAHALREDYPDVPLTAAVAKAGIGGSEEELAVLAVLCAPRMQPATVNLLAPILINSEKRRGAQVFLEGSRFGTRELFVVPGAEDSQEQEQEDRASSAPEPQAAVR